VFDFQTVNPGCPPP